MKRLALPVATAIALGFALACGGGGVHAEPSTALFDRAKAENWTIASKSDFYPLHGELDRHSIPKKGAAVPLEPLASKHFGKFSLSPDRTLLATESASFGTPTGNPHFLVFDENFEVVFQQPELKHFDIYAGYRWSPDGTHIVYAHGNEVVLLNWESRESRSLASDHTLVERDRSLYSPPSWAPDGKRLVYETTEQDIVIRDLEGTELARWPGCMPTWSPDGSTIAYRLRAYEDRNRVRAYDVKTQQTRELFAGIPIEDHVFWTPDSRYLLFRRGIINSIMGELHFYSFDDTTVYTTTKKLPTTRDAEVVVLPDWFEKRLSIYGANATENPNRNPR